MAEESQQKMSTQLKNDKTLLPTTKPKTVYY